MNFLSQVCETSRGGTESSQREVLLAYSGETSKSTVQTHIITITLLKHYFKQGNFSLLQSGMIDKMHQNIFSRFQ